MLKKLKAMLKKLEARKAAVVTKADAAAEIEELRSLNTELDDINKDIAECRSLISEAEEKEAAAEKDPSEKKYDNADPEADEKTVEERSAMAAFKQGQVETPEAKMNEEAEKRGLDLKAGKAIVVDMELRATSLGSSNLVNEKKYSRTLKDTFNEVSGLIDRVNVIPLIGGESYTQAYVISYAEGDYTTETGTYTDGDPVTNYVDVAKAKITAYSEITDEAAKLPNINYQALIQKNVRTALRKKITKQIISGAGGSNKFTGIFNANTTVMPTAGDLEISEIDADTLDDIVFGYGGDEDVEGGASLILNKKDLAAFAAVRTSDGEKLYTIKISADQNGGTISSKGSFEVPYIINSECPALSLAATAADTYCMAYGKLMAYDMPIFSQVEIMESKDFKFSTGQICYRAVVWAGGNVTKYKGFTRVKKVAAV